MLVTVVNDEKDILRNVQGLYCIMGFRCCQ